MFRGLLTMAVLLAVAGNCPPIGFSSLSAAEPTRDEAVSAMQRACQFFREHCSAGGGYVFRLSSDLRLREGELAVGSTTAWIEPPATPAVGHAYLDAYRLTGEASLLEAARETAQALLQGQLLSGGWTEQIEFAPQDRQRYAYRVEGDQVGERRNTTTFDDDKTQSALRFLMSLDHELEQADARLHEAVVYGLAAVLEAQYSNGAWPQRYQGQPAAEVATLSATYPASWSRTFPSESYSDYFTLNDGTLSDLIETMLLAGDIYDDPAYTAAAFNAGEFLLRAQMPDPQPGWAQQYDPQMHPAWARKFEPPAISGGESQAVMRTLVRLYQRTGDRRYADAVQRGLAYFRTCLLPDGRLARFYELQSNRPLYFTTNYELTYRDDDLPTHYSFKVTSQLDRISRELQRALDDPPRPPADAVKQFSAEAPKPKLTAQLEQAAAEAIASLDERGAWVEPGRLRTYPQADVREIISSSTFIKNVNTLAQFIAAQVP